MSSGKVQCTCGWSWNKSDSSKKDMYICHECGRDNSNNMKNGGWLDNYNDSETSVPEGYVGEGYSTKGRNYSPAWGGQFQSGGRVPIYVESKNDPRYKAYQDSLSLYKENSYQQFTENNDPEIKNKLIQSRIPYNSLPELPTVRGKRVGFERKDKTADEKNKKSIIYSEKIKPEYFNLNKFIDFDDAYQLTSYYKKPQQEVKVKPTTTKQTAKPITQVVNNLKPAGLVSDDLEIDSTNFPELRPQVKPVKDWKYIWKHAGSTEWGHVNSPEDMDKWVDWRDWYSTGGGKDKGDSVEIIPEYQMGGNIYPVNYVPQAQWGLPVGPFTPLAPLALSAANKVKSWWNDDEPVKPIKKPTTQGKPRTLNIVDPRKKMATTNQPLRPNSDLVGGKYNSNHLDKLMQEAKRQKLSKQDMMTLSAMGFQETKWGRSDGNIGHVLGNWKGNDHYQKFISAYKEKMKEADRLGIKDPATRLQVYNGMGTITPKTEKNYHGFEMQKIYGVPIPKGGINMKKNPLYGKQVMDIRDNVLAKNPEYLQYMDSIYKAPVPAYMQDVRMNKQKPPRFIIPPLGKKEMGGSIPGAVGFSYARTNDPAPDNGPGAKKTMASAQNGIKKPIPSYQDFLKSIKKDKVINLREEPREIVRDNTRVVFRDEKGKQREVNPNKPIATTYNRAEREKALVADRKARIADSMVAQDEDIIGNPNWREVMARETQAIGDKFRLFPEEDSFFDNYLNPGVMIGNMASGLGQAPYRAEQTDSYMPYVTSIGMPLAVGALGGLGANSNTQFVNNLVNPVAGLNIRRGLNNFTNELVSHARSLGPNRRVVTNSFGNEQVGDLVQRLRSNQPLGEMQIGSLGQAYNSGSLSRADSELFTRYLIDRNRVTPSPPGGLFGMTAEETAEQYARMQENPMGWGTERWNVNNQLAPPPSEIRFNIDGSTESIYSARPQYPSRVPGPGNIDLRRPINGHAPGTPEWERLNNQIWEAQNMMKPTLRNKSGYTKEDLLNQASSKDKEVISKMTEKEFQETVFTPKGEVLNYKPSAEIDQMAYNPVTGGSALKDQIPLSNEEYAKVFNENIDVLNDIISKNNTSGVNYSVSELTPSGQLIFNTPAQKVAANRSFVDIMRTPVDEFRNVVRNEMDLPAGQSSWTVNIKPGQWRGEVENIANPEYYKSIPGLDMSNTSRSVFADNVPRRGTGTYESINEYLKRLDLGRVKPGFNSQTQFSKGLWENAIKKDKAFGFYGNPGTVYGSMKSIAPYLGIGGVGAAAASQTEEEVVPGMKQGGVIKDDMGQWAHPGEITEIGSNQITMQGVPYDVLGISDEGDTKLMKPGKNYRFKGKKVTEFPMAKNGLRQEQKGLVNLDQLTNFTNYNTKQPGGWLDKY